MPGESIGEYMDWEKTWKVELMEDEQSKELIQRRIGLYPWAVELHTAPLYRLNMNGWSIHVLCNPIGCCKENYRKSNGSVWESLYGRDDIVGRLRRIFVAPVWHSSTTS